jgi:biopolymer transport protein ExbD
MKTHSIRQRSSLESLQERIPNLAPMVDVIMVILVFFMLGASLRLAREGVLQTELDPRSGPGGSEAVEIIPAVKIGLEDVDHGKSFQMYVMGEPLKNNTFEGLRQLLDERRAAGADTMSPVVIGAQAGVRWQFVIQAMDAAVQAHFRNVQFAVHLGASSPPPS